MYSRRVHREKAWKSFSKAIKNIFSRFPSKSLDEPKSFYCPVRSLYECPCDYHHSQREERFEANFSQHHRAEEIQLHGDVIFQYKDDQEKGTSLNDACANLVKSLQQVNDADAYDVDKRAEEFIKQVGEQLRNSKFSYEN